MIMRRQKKKCVKELQLCEPRSQNILWDENVKMIPALYFEIGVEFVIDNLKKPGNFAPLQIIELTNKTGRLQHHIKIAKERISGDDTLPLSILQYMTPNSKNMTLKRVASTPGLSPIQKRLRETCVMCKCTMTDYLLMKKS